MRHNWMINHADELRAAAQARRNRGISTGRRAAGWKFKRAAPERGSWEEFAGNALRDYREACALAVAEFQWQTRIRFDVEDVTDADGIVRL